MYNSHMRTQHVKATMSSAAQKKLEKSQTDAWARENERLAKSIAKAEKLKESK